MIFRLLIAILTACLLPTATAHAHVLITDETKTHGAILHIVPDDNPIAGQQSILYFDIQERIKNVDTKATLSIGNTATGDINTPAVTIDGTLATAKHTFETQGVYTLTYTIHSSVATYTFTHTQRISRGTVGSAIDQPTYIWAEALTVASAAGLLTLAIIAVRHRKAIAQQSKL